MTESRLCCGMAYLSWKDMRGMDMIKRNIYVLYAIACLQGMVFYGPVATLYREARGISIWEIAGIESVSLVLSLLLELPWGVLADKIGYRRTLLVCNGLFLVSKVIFWKAESFGGFLAERVLLSVVLAGLSGVDTAVLYLSCEGEDSQQVFGIYEGCQTAGLLTAAFVYAVAIGDRYETAAVLTVVAYGLAAGLTLLLREVRNPRAVSERTERMLAPAVTAVLKRPRMLLFLVGAALFNETHQMATVFLNQLQYLRAGMTAHLMGYVYIGVTVAGLCGVFSARLTRRLGEKGLLRSCCLAAAAACALLAVTGNAVVSVLGILTLRVSFSLLQPLQLEVQNRQAAVEDRATALSAHAAVMNGVAVGANVIFGALAECSLSVAFIFGAVLCSLGMCLMRLQQTE